jgi:hypothetical protein
VGQGQYAETVLLPVTSKITRARHAGFQRLTQLFDVKLQLESVDTLSRQETGNRFCFRRMCQTPLDQFRVAVLQTVALVHVPSPGGSVALRDIFISKNIEKVCFITSSNRNLLYDAMLLQRP